MRRLFKRIVESTKDDNFMHHIESIEVVVSKLLSVAMVVVILVAIFDLGVLLIKELFSTPYGRARFGAYHLLWTSRTTRRS
ncbi:MAG: hypothetical protein KME31_27550 [Tolypothrix carrinoi HA7290-LM1]|jgi:uncharacterized membrane protein (DUF373 family)|nr:hypothetical protein [Tolypothrix carrinoi HA7290-LM1]